MGILDSALPGIYVKIWATIEIRRQWEARKTDITRGNKARNKGTVGSKKNRYNTGK